MEHFFIIIDWLCFFLVLDWHYPLPLGTGPQAQGVGKFNVWLFQFMVQVWTTLNKSNGSWLSQGTQTLDTFATVTVDKSKSISYLPH